MCVCEQDDWLFHTRGNFIEQSLQILLHTPDVMVVWCRDHRDHDLPMGMQCVAVCCSVLQCVAVRWSFGTVTTVTSIFLWACSVLQCVAVCCRLLQCVAVCCSELHCVAVCWSVGTANTMNTIFLWVCNMLQGVAAYCNVLQRIALCCSVLQ